jgi:hypothetical protein
MAKKKAKKKVRRRKAVEEWNIGQALEFSKKEPKKDDVQNALDIVEHAIGESLVPPKRKTRDP